MVYCYLFIDFLNDHTFPRKNQKKGSGIRKHQMCYLNRKCAPAENVKWMQEAVRVQAYWGQCILSILQGCVWIIAAHNEMK